MYSKKKAIVKTGSLSLGNYIEGNDLFNSKFLYMFRKLPSMGLYSVNVKDYRLDTISMDLYGDHIYGEYILIYNGITIAELKPEMELRVFDEKDVATLITNLTSIDSPRDFLKNLKY
jgi:hypothetical protein